MPYTFDPLRGRYRDERGRFVSESSIRAAVDAVVDESSKRAMALTAQLQAGRLSLADWQAAMMASIKQAHVAAGVAAAGGFEQMSPANYGYLGSRIRAQYEFLRNWAAELASGKAPLDGLLPTARAALYGQAARGTFEAARAREQILRGAVEQRNKLGKADHCAGCLEENGRGWVDAGELVPIGERLCKTRCRCTILYRQADQAKEAAA